VNRTLFAIGLAAAMILFAPLSASAALPPSVSFRDHGTGPGIAAAAASDTPATVMGTPLLISFGTVDVGQESKPRDVTWTNTTNATINIFNWVVIANPPFDFYNFDQSSCAQIGATLLPSSSCSFQVIFRPASSGRSDGQISFSYYITDPSQPQFVIVALKGSGK
jgi:hypothetical protein